jgi:putative addiction module component (TIGR02574 family)
MAATSSKILSEAMKLPVQERVRVAEKLLESADAEGFEDESEATIQTAWAEELQKRSRELKDGSVRGLSAEEARLMIASDPADDER